MSAPKPYGELPALDFLASVSDKIDGFLYRCHNDPDYTMVRLTSGFDRMFERSSADMVLNQRSFADLIHEADLPIISGAVNRALEAGKRWRIVYRFKHMNGDWVWVYESGGGVSDPDTGAIPYLDGVVLEISQFGACLDAQAHDLATDLG